MLALAAIALIPLVQAGAAGARIMADAGARPLAESPPTITQQPSSKTVTQGQPALFTSSASNSPTVQWEVSTDGGKSFQPIQGATSNTYSIASTTSAQNGYQFRAFFTNGAGQATSNPATLTVNSPPVITLQPVDANTAEGQEATFESKATGLPVPTVQWEVSTNGGSSYKNVSGATGTTLHLASVTKSQEGSRYRAVFKNSVRTTISEAATLHVRFAPVVGQQPFSRIVKEGESASFSSSASGNPAPTVQWERSADGGKTFHAIAGATAETYVIAATTPAEDGYLFRAVWTNLVGSAVSTIATLTVRSAPKVTEQPEPQVVLSGASATFEAAATGQPAPTVQWQMSTDGGTSFAPISGATSDTLTVPSAQLSESGRLFRAVFSNLAGVTATEAAQLTVVTTDYAAYGWGPNNRGQTGTGGGATVLAPAPIPNLSFVTQLSAGGRHGLALQAGGRVYSWGYNGHGQLGNAEAVGVTTPTPIEHLSGVTAVAAGGNHSLALLSNGTVTAWGDDESGQLGDGKSTDSEVPVPVPGLSGVTAIAAGEEHSLALLADGAVMAWGNNENGQLGTGNLHPSDEPVAVQGLSGVTAIAAGGHFSMALLEDGTVVTWGSDSRLQLGNEAVALEEVAEEDEAGSHSETPVPVDGLSNVKAIAAGRTHALALLKDGSVVAWGDDSKGELGNGAIEEDNGHESAVGGLSGVTAISAGDRGGAAVLAGGAVMTWGMNESGSLGNGTQGEPSPVPIQASNIGQAVGVAYGGGHVLAFGESGPVVTSLSPKEGPAVGGGSVTISGVNLGSASAVHFGAAAASSFTVNSSNSITATPPPGTGTVDVTVTTPAGTSPPKVSDRYNYRPLPTVTKLSAKGGPATGGTAITITGTNLTGATAVNFGGVPATEVKVLSATSMSATAPANIAGYADVTVTTIGGTSATTSKDRFKYAPVIEAVTPPNGSVAGGNTVTITGTGFPVGTDTVKFKFGKGASKSVQCTSTSSCSVLVPVAKALGTVDVMATANKGKSTAAPGDHYTYE